MLIAKTAAGMILAAAGLVTVCSSLAEIDVSPVALPWHGNGVHPVAALAWAQAHCDVDLAMQPGTPRLQGEDFLRMAAKLEALEAKRGRNATCLIATKLAGDVAARTDLAAASHDGLVALAK